MAETLRVPGGGDSTKANLVVETVIIEADTTIKIGGGVCFTLGGTRQVPIVLESNQNHATVKETEVCTTLPASMGLGGVMCR